MNYSIICTLALSWWGILNGQAHRPVPTLFVGKSDSADTVGQTVPVEAGEAGTVAIRILPRIILDDTSHQDLALDNLELRLLQLEITKAEEKVGETSFWRRILPQIHFSASFGMHDLMFIDQTSFTPYIFPRDAYRLTISISLNDVLLSPTHTQATIDLQRLKVALSLRTMQIMHTHRMIEQQLAAFQEQSESLEKERCIVQDLLRFNELRFRQGRIEYDALARTKLELLGVQRSIKRIQQQQSALRLKLSGEGAQ